MADGTCASPECSQPPRARIRANGPDPRYCSSVCANRASYLRRGPARNLRLAAQSAKERGTANCVICGVNFHPPTKRSKTCSRSCLRKLYRDSATVVCSSDGCDRAVRAKGLCSKHYKATHPNRKAWKKQGRPEVRRAALRKRTQLRRALTRDPNAEPIDRDEIGHRDGWKCGLCGERVRQSLTYPHPRSASLDHIVPLAEGGKHTRTNVQISHLQCNVAKGARGGGEQLLLIG
jgi:hypothetical protein